MDRADFAVEQWERERPDLPSLPMAIFGRLSEASEVALRDHMNPVFAQAGLQPGEFDVLATLRRAGTPCKLTPTELYEALMISSGGITNRIDRLERAGLVERQSDPRDRRGKLIALTSRGRLVIDEVLGKHVRNEQRLLTGLSTNQQIELDKLLRALLESMRSLTKESTN